MSYQQQKTMLCHGSQLRASSAQVKARARQIQEQLRRLINSLASLSPYSLSFSAICNGLSQQTRN